MAMRATPLPAGPVSDISDIPVSDIPATSIPEFLKCPNSAAATTAEVEADPVPGAGFRSFGR